MKKYISKIKDSILYKFIVLSSANPKQTSMMFQGLLMGLIPAVMIIFGALDITVENQKLEDIITLATTALFVFFSLVSLVQTTVGGIRKIGLTVLGKNQAIQSKK